jgi:hypothetical protein
MSLFSLKFDKISFFSLKFDKIMFKNIKINTDELNLQIQNHKVKHLNDDFLRPTNPNTKSETKSQQN